MVAGLPVKGCSTKLKTGPSFIHNICQNISSAISNCSADLYSDETGLFTMHIRDATSVYKKLGDLLIVVRTEKSESKMLQRKFYIVLNCSLN